jgi:hypothetical protein
MALIPLITGPLDPSNTENTLNALIQEINAIQPVGTLAGAMLTVTPAMAGGVIRLNAATGNVVTLPAATGSGNKYEFHVDTTVTSNATTIDVARTADKMVGNAFQVGATGAVTGFHAVVGTSNGISLNGSTTGGIAGDRVVVSDDAMNQWSVLVQSSITGSAATPFSAAV